MVWLCACSCLYVGLGSNGVVGKLNTDNGTPTGNLHNLWIQNESYAHGGEPRKILTQPIGRQFYWQKCCQGDMMPENAICIGNYHKDGLLWIGKSENGEIGKLTVVQETQHSDRPTILKLWTHYEGGHDSGFQVLCDKEIPTTEHQLCLG